MKHIIVYSFLAGALALSSCKSSYSVELLEGGRIPVTAAFDQSSDETAAEILSTYKAKVDSIMCPVIGHSQKKLASFRPESPLSNFMADLLRIGAEKELGVKPEIGVMNMGGIRNIINPGAITIGEIYEICPFQNALSMVTLRGDALLELFEQIAALHGEGLSGAELVISEDGKLLSARVGSKQIDPKEEYRIATIDYIAAGNDHMEAFKKAVDKVEPEDAILRDIFIDYVKDCEARGRMIDAKVEGRITVK